MDRLKLIKMVILPKLMKYSSESQGQCCVLREAKGSQRLGDVPETACQVMVEPGPAPRASCNRPLTTDPLAFPSLGVGVRSQVTSRNNPLFRCCQKREPDGEGPAASRPRTHARSGFLAQGPGSGCGCPHARLSGAVSRTGTGPRPGAGNVPASCQKA